MAKTKVKYLVTNSYTGDEYETFAVSPEDAINHIHYKLWFGAGIWTEMSDFEAIPERLVILKEMMEEHKRHEEQKEIQLEPQYHQMTLFEVGYDS